MKTSKFAFEINWPLDLRNLQEQAGKAFCYQKLFWPFTVQINCFTDSFCTVRECTFNIQYPEGKCRVVSNSIPGFLGQSQLMATDEQKRYEMSLDPIEKVLNDELLEK